MNCPKCKRGEIEPAGTCPVCGYGIVKSAQPAFLPFPGNENILSFPAARVKKKIDSGSRLRVVKEKPVPSWRLEISQKVQQVLRARELKQGGSELAATEELAAAGNSTGAGVACAGAVTPSLRQETAFVLEEMSAPAAVAMGSLDVKAEGGLPMAAMEVKAPVDGSSRTQIIAPAVETFVPPLIKISSRVPVVSKGVVNKMQETMQWLQPPLESVLANPIDFQMSYPPEPSESAAIQSSAPDQQGLLLSRTLSGLIDFITVLFCSVPFFFTLVYLLGYEHIGSFELMVLLGVCSTLFLLYSVFFVTFSGQTIGMMITDLQVVDVRGELPSYSRACKRVLAFVLALGTGGLGLAWGMVDRKRRCLHDLLSRTMVVRVDSAEVR